MAVESVKKHVSVAIKSCNGLVLRHPLLVFTLFVLFWIYLFFPLLFWILVRALPVIASSLVLLGTLLFYGHANVAKVDKGKIHNHNLKIVDESYFINKLNQEKKSEVVAKSEMKISSNGSQRNSIVGNIGLDDRGWETGSDLVGSSSPRSSMGDMFPMLDELDPLLKSEVRQHTHMSNVISTDYGSDHSIEADDYDDEDDDDDERDMEVKDDEDEEEEDDIVITWTDDDQRNLMNLGTSELERNQRLENLIARQQALKNMRMIAENNMVNINPNLALNATHISTARMNPFDNPYDSNQNILGSAPSVIMPRRNPFDLPYEPSGQKLPDQVGPTFQSNDPFIRRHESFDVGPYFVLERVASDGINYSSLHRQVGEDDPYREADLSANQEKNSNKSSSSSFFDVADDIYDGDDEEEEEFRSIDMSSSQDLKDLQIEDSGTDSSGSNSGYKTGNRLSQKQHGLKSWLTGWKA